MGVFTKKCKVCRNRLAAHKGQGMAGRWTCHECRRAIALEKRRR